MAISLPSSPTIGQTYTLGGKIWTWNGTAWKLPSTTGVLPVLYGGTGVTTSTGTGSTVLSASPTFTGTLGAAAIIASTTLGVTGTSTLNGNAIISVTDNTNAALRITQLGSGNALLVEDSTNPDSTPVVIDSVGQVVVGNSTSIANTALEVVNSITRFTYANNAFSGGLSQRKSRSTTIGTKAIVQSGDELGNLLFYGDDGSTDLIAARIAASVDGTPGTNDMPGRLVFSTTADGAASPTERMRINSSGTVSIPGNLSIAAYTETIVASGTVGASATLAITAGTFITATLTTATACTFTMPTVAAGKSFILYLRQPTTGTATTATFTNVKWGSSGAPTITATVGKMDILSFSSDGTAWYGAAAQGYTY